MTAYYLSVDIGGTFIKSALYDHEGSMLHRLASIPTSYSEAGLKEALSQLVAEGQDYLVDFRKAQKGKEEKLSVDDQLLAGLALSTTGIIDPTTGAYVRSGSFPFMIGVNLRRYIEDRHQLPCRVINDGQAALWGEMWQGNLQGVDNGLLVTIGTGIVSGHVFNGQPYFGAHGQAGELSSVTQNEYEPYFPVKYSSTVFIEQAADLLALKDKQDGQAVFDALDQGHNDLRLMFESYCHRLALLFFNLTVTLDPEIIVMSGGICRQERFVKEVQRQFQHVYRNKSADVLGPCQTNLAVSAVLSDANLLGALFYLLDQQ